MNSIDLKVSGMTCGSCVSHVRKALSNVEGVQAVEVDLASGHVRVRGEVLPALDVMLHALAAAGYAGAAAQAGESPGSPDAATNMKPGPTGGRCCCR